MSSKLIDLNNLEKANQDYLHGLDLIQTSCIKCRCKPNYLDAIPYFKKQQKYIVDVANMKKRFKPEKN